MAYTFNGIVYPDATNTGVPAGVTLTSHPGDLVINTAGAVISGLNITGTVYINAPNVTIQNCSITSSGYDVVNIKTGVTGAVVQNCVINGTGAGPQGQAGIGGAGTFLNNNIYNVENGINVEGSNTVIKGNYIHDLNDAAGSAGHYDGIAVQGGFNNTTIDHNTVLGRDTSCVFIDNDFGAMNNIVVNNNLLLGQNDAAASIYVIEKSGNPAQITNVQVTNNVIGKGHWYWASVEQTEPVWNNNVDYATGKIISTQNVLSSAPATPPPAPTSPTALAAPKIVSFSDDTGKLATDHITNDNTLTLSGTAAANSTVKIFDGTGTSAIATKTADASGQWTLTTPTLSDGAHNLTATSTSSGQTSAASTALAVTIDTIAPAAPVATGEPNVNTNQVLASGTAAANSTIAVYDGNTVVGSVAADASGNWSVTTSTLSSGSHILVAKATDAAGNVSAASQPFDPVIGGGSTTPPTTTLSTTTLTGIVHVGNNYFLGSSTGPELKYGGAGVTTGQFEDWIPISSVKVDGGGYDVAWKNSSGQFTFWATDSQGNFQSYPTKGVALAGNSTTVESYETIFHQDLNGDHTIGIPSATATLTTPTPTPTTPASAVNFSSLTESSSNVVTIQGTADALSKVNISDGNAYFGTTTAGADGTWSLSKSVSDTVHTFKAVEIDSAGNTTASSGRAIIGSSGSNTLTSTAGNDILVGNGHPDTFVFAPNFGKDVITDFRASGWGHDTVQFSTSVFDSFAKVLAHATQSGENVVIADSAGDSLTLKNVKLAALDQHDFHFA